MNDGLFLRASALPLAFRCPASVRRATLPISETSEPADLGSAAHEALRALPEGRGIQWADLPAIAAKWNVTADELRMLAAMGNGLWPELAPMFPNAMTELALSAEIADGVRLSGHLDALSVVGAEGHALDWKTGRKDSDYSQQMRGYAALTLLDDARLTKVTIFVVWVRDGEVERYTMTREQLPAWLDELRVTVVEWDGVYRPGPHCRYCPRSHECAAVNAIVRRDVSAILDTGGAPSLLDMPPAEIVALYRKAGLVIDYAERVRAIIKAHVETNGDVVTHDGRLTLVQETRRELDTLAAWPVLEAAGFDDDDFAECVKLSLSKVEKRVAQKAGRGKGKAAIQELGAKLQAVGAIKTNTITKLTEKR